MKIIFAFLVSLTFTNLAWSKSLTCTSRWSISSTNPLSDLPGESGALSVVEAKVRNSQGTPLKVKQLDAFTVQFELPPPLDEKGDSNYSTIKLSSKAEIEFEITHMGRGDWISLTATSSTLEQSQASSSGTLTSNVSLGVSGRWSNVKCDVE